MLVKFTWYAESKIHAVTPKTDCNSEVILKKTKSVSSKLSKTDTYEADLRRQCESNKNTMLHLSDNYMAAVKYIHLSHSQFTYTLRKKQFEFGVLDKTIDEMMLLKPRKVTETKTFVYDSELNKIEVSL